MAIMAFTISLTLFLLFMPVTSSVSDSEALINLKKSFTNSTSLASWVEGSSPCDAAKLWKWKGVICANGIVTGLRLRRMGLSGKIDIDSLVHLPGLRSLSLVHNSFSGSLPDFNRLGALKAIYLSGNQFSGKIASQYFVTMGSLKKVWLSDNQFSDKIPISLAELPHLIELHLENNQFKGLIPSMAFQTLISLNVSNNNLEGKIPENLAHFPPSSFLGNKDLCGKNIEKICDPSKDLKSFEDAIDLKWRRESERLATAIMTTGAILFIVVIIAIVILKRKRDEAFEKLRKQNLGDEIEVYVSDSTKKDTPKQDIDSSNKTKGPSPNKTNNTGTNSGKQVGGVIGDLEMVNDEKGVFKLTDLMKAAAEVLGNGGLGSAYKVLMTNGVTVVVKRLRDMNKLGKDGFVAEINKYGMFKHENVLPPLAYHYRRDEKLFVYEFMPKGSLLYLLHGDHGPSHEALDWPSRLKIIRGISKGLMYLHTKLPSSKLPHGNLKSSNIVLSAYNEPLLSDYGYHQLTNTTKASQVLFGYKAPEATIEDQISPKCDVYSFGIVILEILTGKLPSQYPATGGTDLVQWIASAVAEKRELDLLDCEIANSAGNSIDEMEKMLKIGAACVESNRERRLDLREAVRLIEEVSEAHNCNNGGGGGGAGGGDERVIQLLPSLRDGYADSTVLSPAVVAAGENGGGGNRLSKNGGDSFAFTEKQLPVSSHKNSSQSQQLPFWAP